MSKINTRNWLMSYHENTTDTKINKRKKYFCKTIAIASGKGGVGKTSCALKMSQLMSQSGCDVLLIDCDFNLTNTTVKLGLNLNNNFLDFLKGKLPIENCIQKVCGFDLLSACSGELDLVNKFSDLTSNIINIISEQEKNYDYIILDCPAGISKETLSLFAYCDEQIVVMTPERSSITDSYSLVKLINTQYKINNVSLLMNKVSSNKQFKKIATVFINTVDNFLECSVKLLGSISYSTVSLDQFDQLLIKDADSQIHQEFSKIVNKYTDKLWTDTECVASALTMKDHFSVSAEVRNP